VVSKAQILNLTKFKDKRFSGQQAAKYWVDVILQEKLGTVKNLAPLPGLGSNMPKIWFPVSVPKTNLP
jgi:hypothetical protein